ncbi:MAG: alpha/beta hydrolase [Anaerolineales bacterium]|jgi:acetyl esterase
MTEKYQLDWKMKLLFWLLGHAPSVSESNLQQTRAGMDADPFGLFSRHIKVAGVENRLIPGTHGDIPVRIYHPRKVGRLPLVVFFHGGGWAIGSLESHDAICRRIAGENGALVVSVGYRLAPEYKYPAAVEDAYDATCWAAEHAVELGADLNKLIVMGDSAGGNLAAVVTLISRESNGPRIAFQVLIYPGVDLGGLQPSKERYADNPFLNGQALKFYADQYIRQPADLKNPYVSPLLADDLRHLPPALILTAEYDPLHDEGESYANCLRTAGNEVIYVCYPGMVHGFISFGSLANGTELAYAEIKQTLQGFSAGIPQPKGDE